MQLITVEEDSRMNEQTLYEYITEKYDFTNDAQQLVVYVYEDMTCEKPLFTFRGTPQQILKHFTFYYLNMIYVSVIENELLCPLQIHVYEL